MPEGERYEAHVRYYPGSSFWPDTSIEFGEEEEEKKFYKYSVESLENKENRKNKENSINQENKPKLKM